MTNGFVISLSIALSIFVMTSVIVLICRKKKNALNTGQVIHYGGPQNAAPPPQYNAPGWQQGCMPISPQSGEPNYQTTGLPSYQTAVYAPSGPHNIIIRQVNTPQYYAEPYQANAVVVTTATENIQK